MITSAKPVDVFYVITIHYLYVFISIKADAFYSLFYTIYIVLYIYHALSNHNVSRFQLQHAY